MSKVDENAVYGRYIEAKLSGGKIDAARIGVNFGISRQRVHQIVQEIEAGNLKKVARCNILSKKECLWEFKYLPRALAIPKNREKESIWMLKNLIWDMHKDDFGVFMIADKLGKSVSVIQHHLNSEVTR